MHDRFDIREGFFETLLEFCPGSVALLQAYFDESERSNGPLCVAGYVFWSSAAKCSDYALPRLLTARF